MIQDYKTEVEDILVGDKQLAKEILFDMKQAEAEREQQETREAAAANQAATENTNITPMQQET
eukprot:scaffold648356_cov36-Prasinocladus_malaysianus.AAC.1